MWPISLGRIMLVPVSWVTPFKKLSKEKLKTSLSIENNTGVQIPQIPKEYGSGAKKDSASYIVYRYVLDRKHGMESNDKTTATASQMLETKTKQLDWPSRFNLGLFPHLVRCCSRDGLKIPELSTHKSGTRNYSTNQDNESMPDDLDKYPKGFPRLRNSMNSTRYVSVNDQKEPCKEDIQRKAEPLTPDNKWKQ